MVRAAIAAVVVLWAGCAFDPSGLGPRAGGGDAGELADQVLVDAPAADAGDAGELADQVLVDGQVLADQVLVDAPAADAGGVPYLASCSSFSDCAGPSPRRCEPDGVTPRDLPARLICTRVCNGDGDCPAPSAGCGAGGTCRGARLEVLQPCEWLAPALCVPNTGFQCNWCASSTAGCLQVGPSSYPYHCAKACSTPSDCPTNWRCDTGGGGSSGLCRWSP